MTLEKLKSVRKIKLELESLEERIIRLRALMERATMVLKRDEGVSGSVDFDKLGSQLAEIDELEQYLCSRVLDYENLIKEIDTWLNSLPPNQSIVMRLRYVDGLSWRKVARRAKYSTQACYRINDQVKKTIE